ncbi:MAG: hypothetical protein U1D30_05970 [Planctomycetota bacterium]
MLAGSTDPIYRTRSDVRFELENLTFQDNVVSFRESEGENVHGTWDSLGNARFIGNQFNNVGQILFVAKRTYDDLQPCENVEFRGNQIRVRARGFASPYNALITSQSFRSQIGQEEFLLPFDQFHAKENVATIPHESLQPELDGWLKSGFDFQEQSR